MCGCESCVRTDTWAGRRVQALRMALEFHGFGCGAEGTVSAAAVVETAEAFWAFTEMRPKPTEPSA
jgi:hypothetical protein